MNSSLKKLASRFKKALDMSGMLSPDSTPDMLNPPKKPAPPSKGSKIDLASFTQSTATDLKAFLDNELQELKISCNVKYVVYAEFDGTKFDGTNEFKVTSPGGQPLNNVSLNKVGEDLKKRTAEKFAQAFPEGTHNLVAITIKSGYA